MSEIEKLTVGGLVTLLAVFTPGFILHTAPRFPGSLLGGLLGIVGASLMVLLLLYPLVKRWAWLRRNLSALPLRSILSLHVYAGALGAMLGILHTGHRFHSPLGITLVVSMLAATFSGFVGRYYMVHLSEELREQKTKLDRLRVQYERLAAEAPAAVAAAGWLGRWLPARRPRPAPEFAALVNAMADLEYGMRSRETIKRAFRGWMVVHIGAALVMYPTLAMHIWNGFYFGLRWL